MEDQPFEEGNINLVIQRMNREIPNRDSNLDWRKWDRVIDVIRNKPPSAKNKSEIHKKEVRIELRETSSSMISPSLSILMKNLSIE